MLTFGPLYENVEYSTPSWFTVSSMYAPFPPPHTHTHVHSHAQKNFISVSAAEDVKDIVVEIESRSIRKPFIGGYRHKITDVEYHHAFTQTPSLQFMVPAGGNYCVV